MQEEANHRALIDKYLNDTLSASEKHEFMLLLNNPDLKEAVLHEKRVVTSLKTIEKARLKGHLKDISAHTPSSTDTQTNHLKRLWLTAATILILASIGYFFYSINQPISSNFDKFYEPYPAVTIQRGEVVEINKGLQLYSDEKYQEAAIELTHLARTEQPVYYLYLGNCYLQLEKPEKAIESFKMLLMVSDDSIVLQHGKWYMALAYLKNNEQEPTKSQLREIIDQEGMYSDLANKLLKTIE